jgi:hypothetical protein
MFSGTECILETVSCWFALLTLVPSKDRYDESRPSRMSRGRLVIAE